MKAVMKSVSPRICEKVAKGDCTILVSKTAPKCEESFKCYIYATKAKKWFRSGIVLTSNELLWLSSGKIKMCDGFELWADGEDYQCVNNKVIGEFICDRIDEIYQCNSGWVKENACISKDEFFDYLGIPRGTHFGYDKKAYAWHISDLKIYGKPLALDDFYLEKAPMSWRYV